MDPRIREQLANLCYAGVMAVVGLVAIVISASTKPEPGRLSDSSAASDIAGLIGSLAMFAALLYLIWGLVRLASVLRDRSDD